MNKAILLFLTLFTFYNVNSQNVITLELTVVNEYTKDPISFANVKIVNLSSNQVIRKKTNFNGNLAVDLQPNMRYSLFAAVQSDSNIVIFSEKNIKFNTEGVQGGTKITSQIKLRPIFQKEGLKFIDNITFGIFTYDLDKIAKAKLDNIVKIMKENPEVKIDVSGFASCNLTVEDANSVSVARATNVFTYLTDAGIDYTRITANAWGKDESKLITKCKCELKTRKDKPCTKKHHILNSRVGITFQNI